MTIIIYKRLKHLCLIRMRSARAPRGFIYSVSEKSVPLKASSGRQREGFVCGVHHRWAATPCYSSLYISSLYLYFCVFLCLYLCICIDVFVLMARHPLLLLFKHQRLHNVDSTTSLSQRIQQNYFLPVKSKNALKVYYALLSTLNFVYFVFYSIFNSLFCFQEDQWDLVDRWDLGDPAWDLV